MQPRAMYPGTPTGASSAPNLSPAVPWHRVFASSVAFDIPPAAPSVEQAMEDAYLSSPAPDSQAAWMRVPADVVAGAAASSINTPCAASVHAVHSHGLLLFGAPSGVFHWRAAAGQRPRKLLGGCIERIVVASQPALFRWHSLSTAIAIESRHGVPHLHAMDINRSVTLLRGEDGSDSHHSHSHSSRGSGSGSGSPSPTGGFHELLDRDQHSISQWARLHFLAVQQQAASDVSVVDAALCLTRPSEYLFLVRLASSGVTFLVAFDAQQRRWSTRHTFRRDSQSWAAHQPPSSGDGGRLPLRPF
jgi:hypothetical protein